MINITYNIIIFFVIIIRDYYFEIYFAHQRNSVRHLLKFRFVWTTERVTSVDYYFFYIFLIKNLSFNNFTYNISIQILSQTNFQLHLLGKETS